MLIYLRLGWRNLWLHPWRSALTSVALAIGIAALIFLTALNEGWMQQVKGNFALTLTGHVQIHARGFEQSHRLADSIRHPAAVIDYLRKQAGVMEVAQRLRVSGLASSAEGNGGAYIYGVEPEVERRLSRLAEMLSAGAWLSPRGGHELLLGDGLADRLHVALGDKVVLMASMRNGEIASEVFWVRGLLHSGVLDIDDSMAIVPLGMAQHWLEMGEGVTDIVLRARDAEAVPALVRHLRQHLDPGTWEVLSWSDIDPMAQQWADFADAYTWVVLLIVILVVLAEVLNTMLMGLHERVREFGLMAALGVRARQLFVMVLWETVLLVLFGGTIGLLLGGALVWWYGLVGIDLSRFAVAFSFMYMEPVIHPALTVGSCARILGAALCGALVAGILPAWRAARLEPVEALREW